ncbi:MAG: hypothetical protein JWO19_456 [Bryobacterales bacterium]|nr:hypothetical protein [Bryobacterales bacterium]
MLLRRCSPTIPLLLILGSAIVAQPARLSPPQLDQLIARIALYPDPLLAQVLVASTHWDQIPEAAAWANQHSYLMGDALARAIQEDNLPWDPSVIALLPFPSVLDMMAKDPVWTQQLGSAVLTQRADVMDAVQRLRKKAKDYGYLRSNSYINVVASGPFIQILPPQPGFIYLPMYEPRLVFAPAAPGIIATAALQFGPRVTIGEAFEPWGWASPGFLWPAHTIVIDRVPWDRRWENREVYKHRYAHPWVRPVGPRVERHELHKR